MPRKSGRLGDMAGSVIEYVSKLKLYTSLFVILVLEA
jgi:hypothetical protein